MIPPGRFQVAVDQEAHGEGRGVPAARGQALEERGPGRVVIEVERLRVERGGEGLDRFRVHPEPWRPILLSDHEVLEIQACHSQAAWGEARLPPSPRGRFRPTARGPRRRHRCRVASQPGRGRRRPP
jgi:hypothetical protein